MVQPSFKNIKNVIINTVKFKVHGCRERGRSKQRWKKQVEDETKKNGAMKKDACDQTKWRGAGKSMTI